MIKPQELRIGSNVNTELGIAEVIGIYEDVVDVKGVSVIDNSSGNKISISTRSFDGCVEYEKIQPIPLTEEILLKFGFDIEWLLSDSKCYYVLINNKKIRIKFVHSLQNIYLCIEQKELNLCL